MSVKEDKFSQIPNQNSLGDIINQIAAVKALNTMMSVVFKSDVFMEIHNINKLDVILYTEISKLFLENFLYIQEEMVKIKKVKLKNPTENIEPINKLLLSILDTMNSFVEKTNNLDLLQERFERFNQVMEVVKGAIDGITDTFKNIFSTLKSIFGEAIIAGGLAIIANKTGSWANIVLGIQGANQVLASISGNSDLARLKTIGYNLISSAHAQFTGRGGIGTGGIGEKVSMMLMVIKMFRSIFFQAILTGLAAQDVNDGKYWKAIKAGIREVNAIGALAGEESIKSVLLDKALGINEIALAEFNRDFMIALKEVFEESVTTGIFAKIANQLKVWKDIKKGVKEVNAIGELSGEESVKSVLLDKALGINEIALAEFNRDFMIALKGVFIASITTGIFAKIANQLKVWKDIKKATKQVHEIYLILLPLVSSLALFKVIGIDPGEAFSPIAKIFMLLPVVFGSMVIAGIFAKPIENLWKPLLIGILVLSGIALAICSLTFVLNILEKISGGNTVIAFLKLTLIISLLPPIFILLSIIGLLAMPLQLLWKPLLIGIGVLAAIALGLGLISIIMEEGSILTGFAKFNLALLLLGVAFVQLVLISVLVVLSVMSWPIVLLGIAVLGLISLALMLIIVPESTPMKILRLNLALLGLIVAMGLLLVLDYVINMIAIKELIYNIFGIIGIMGTITLLFIALLIMSPLLLVASISVVIVLSIIVMILLIAGSLKLLELIEIDENKVYKNIKLIKNVINEILGIFHDDSENKEEIPKIDTELWKVDKLLSIMLAIPLLAGSFIAISFIILISLELMILQFIPLDHDAIIANLDVVLNTISDILNKLFQKPKQLDIKEEDSVGTKIGKFLFNGMNTSFSKFSAISNMILAIPMLLAAVIVVGLVLITAKMLKSLAEMQFGEDDVAAINNNINTILKTIDYLNNAISAPYKKFEKKEEDNSFVKGLKSLGNKIFSGIGKISDLAESLGNAPLLASAMLNVGLIKVIAENLKTIQDTELDSATIEGRVTNLLGICKTINTKLNSADIDGITPEKVELFTSYVKNIQDFIGGINKISDKKVDAFVKVVDKANSIDTNKIKSVRDMFEQMARFSESIHGDFDKLADVLSEKLVDILQKLHITLEGLSNNENGVGDTNTENNFSGEKSTVNKNTNVNTIEDKAKEKQKQQEKNIKDIKDALDEITLVLKGVRDNTDNYYRGGVGGV